MRPLPVSVRHLGTTPPPAPLQSHCDASSRSVSPADLFGWSDRSEFGGLLTSADCTACWPPSKTSTLPSSRSTSRLVPVRQRRSRYVTFRREAFEYSLTPSARGWRALEGWTHDPQPMHLQNHRTLPLGLLRHGGSLPKVAIPSHRSSRSPPQPEDPALTSEGQVDRLWVQRLAGSTVKVRG
jgi:hypothetical protein